MERSSPTSATTGPPADESIGSARRGAGAWLPWALRASWIAVGVTGASAIDAATADRSDPVATTATFGAAVVWLVGVAALAIPSVWSLTITRIVVPLSIVGAVASTWGGAGSTTAAAFVAAGLVSTALASSSEVGHQFVGASAYGDEQRFPLRPPVGYAAVAVLAWTVWSTAVVAGPLLLAARSWLLGAVVTALAIAAPIALVPRWHRLSRRWIVLVPAGVVLHDPLVLGETIMTKRSEIARMRLAPADTAAFDLTGPAPGHAVEVELRSTVTALVAPTPERREGRAVHLTAYLACPSRPGRLLRVARERRLPVG